MIYDIYAYWF